MAGSTGYRVRVHVRDQLAAAWWSETFSGLDVTAEPDGTTLLAGELPDQAALHGLLASVRDLGLSLVSVETTAFERSGAGGAGSEDAPRGRGGTR